MADTIFLRFLATLLVTNSHLDGLYPISWLASGGALGNSLFFMISGLGLALSTQKRPTHSFFTWFLHRISKIYPVLWLVVLCFPLLLASSWQKWGLQDYFHQLIYPTHYWFLSALLFFYILIYPLLRIQKRHWVLWLILLLIIPYFYLYCTALDLSHFTIEDKGMFKWIFYFQVMLFGTWLAPIYQNWKESTQKANLQDFLILGATCCLYICIKFLNAKGILTHWQFLAHWMTFPFVYFCLRCTQHYQIETLLKQGMTAKLINLVASATLEIYLLQCYLYSLPTVTQFTFPWNVGVFWILIVPIAALFHQISGWLVLKERIKQP